MYTSPVSQGFQTSGASDSPATTLSLTAVPDGTDAVSTSLPPALDLAQHRHADAKFDTPVPVLTRMGPPAGPSSRGEVYRRLCSALAA
jgi:hypothetical protein